MNDIITGIIVLIVILFLIYIWCRGGVNMHHPDLTGKVVVVTGANKGIGQETIRALARLNATVVCCSRHEEAQIRVNMLIGNETKNRKFEFVKCDLMDLNCVKNAAEYIIKKYEKVDVLICNAGIMASPFKLSKQNNISKLIFFNETFTVVNTDISEALVFTSSQEVLNHLFPSHQLSFQFVSFTQMSFSNFQLQTDASLDDIHVDNKALIPSLVVLFENDIIFNNRREELMKIKNENKGEFSQIELIILIKTFDVVREMDSYYGQTAFFCLLYDLLPILHSSKRQILIDYLLENFEHFFLHWYYQTRNYFFLLIVLRLTLAPSFRIFGQLLPEEYKMYDTYGCLSYDQEIITVVANKVEMMKRWHDGTEEIPDQFKRKKVYLDAALKEYERAEKMREEWIWSNTLDPEMMRHLDLSKVTAIDDTCY